MHRASSADERRSGAGAQRRFPNVTVLTLSVLSAPLVVEIVTLMFCVFRHKFKKKLRREEEYCINQNLFQEDESLFGENCLQKALGLGDVGEGGPV